MPVMATRMHDTGMRRREFETGFFLNGKRIRIGPQHHTRHSGFPVNVGDDSMARDVRAVMNAKLVKKPADDCGRPSFLPTQLRISMELSPHSD
jgi:hypothetical protein